MSRAFLRSLPLRSKINLAIMFTFVVVALVSSVFLSIHASRERQENLRRIEVLLHSVVAQRYETLANEIFARQDRAVAATLEEMRKVPGMVGVTVYLPDGTTFCVAGLGIGQPMPIEERHLIDQGPVFSGTLLGDRPVLRYAEALTVIGEKVGYLELFSTREDLDRRINMMLALYFCALAVILLIMLGLLSWLMRRTVLVPVRRLRDAMQRVREGSPGETVSLETGDEIGGMAQAFNAMSLTLRENADSLRASRRQIEEYNRTLEHKVRERTLDLEKANFRLTGEVRERELARAEAQRLLNLLASTIESTAEGILVVDENKDIIACNRMFLELFGLPDTWPSLPSSESRLAMVASRLKDPSRFISRSHELNNDLSAQAFGLMELANGRLLEGRLGPYKVQGVVAGRLYTILDVTDRVRVEHHLRDTVVELEAIVENSLVGIAMTRNGFCRKINRRGAEILGYRPEDLTGKHLSMIYTSLDDAPAFEERYRNALLNDGAFRGEEDVRRGDGTVGWVRIYAKALDLAHPDGDVILAFDDIGPQKRLEEGLRAAKDAAEAAARAKSDFLAAMSHEIRTPLNAVVGMTEATLATALTPEQRDYLDTVRDSATHLLGVLNDILDFSKIEAGRLELERIDFDLRRTLENTAKVLGPEAEARGLYLTLDIDPDVPFFLRGDPMRLRQVVFNLAGNAVKFTERGGVRIDVSRLAQDMVPSGRVGLRVTVSDTGIGIPADKLEGIFESFTQAAGSISRKYGGTGLGLSISRQIVELMGGEITVRSTPGEGSRFAFTALFEAGNPDLVKDTAESPPLVSDTRPLRLLLVEDNEINARVATLMLSRLGHSTVHAQSAHKALTLLCREDFDAVLMDIEMPDTDGLTTSRLIRKGGEGTFRVRHPGVPIIAMTAHALQEVRQECIQAGMDDFLTKPVSQANLARALHRATSGRAGPRDMWSDTSDSSADAARPPQDAPVLDKGSVTRNMGIGDKEYRMLLSIGAREVRSGLELARRALTAGDMPALARSAHTMKSSLGVVGALSCREAAARLEDAARSGDPSRAGEAFRRLKREAAKVLGAWEEMTGAEGTAPPGGDART
ncbi:MAG: response regulator [Desulfovibrio sp.]|nr:response regulator [Desulfovibrio sp.]